ncbi:hypothetical protein PNP85_05085 [Halobacterium salinarum]|uniref:hypothetical protein n=1 Tax=Halobacterium salinarum TaxID=2242 RepID=UPI00255481B0|nr:hypothetical protein [Halobacterium salinarum]MDL0138874.1 hypothetical protein [Halobacterium salinarum]
MQETRLYGIHGQGNDYFVQVYNGAEDFMMRGFEGHGQALIEGSATNRANIHNGKIDGQGRTNLDGVAVRGGTAVNVTGVTSVNNPGQDLLIMADNAEVGGVAHFNDERGVWFTGGVTGATFRGSAYTDNQSGGGYADVEFDDATRCKFYGDIDGEVELTSNTSNCTVYVSVSGAVTNNGTGCEVV